jgi:SAM-dependent methyltransferase
VVKSWDKYADDAARWSEAAYADPAAYLAHRADLVRTLGPALVRGDRVLDLACGDAGLAEFLPEQRYTGVDASPEMASAAARRGRTVRVADINEYEPSEPVQATMVFRALYYVADRKAFFTHVGSYTEKKLVFDLNPRQYSLGVVAAELREAGFGRLETRPFFVPQTVSLPVVGALALRGLERTGPLAALLLRYRFTLLLAASRPGAGGRSRT